MTPWGPQMWLANLRTSRVSLRRILVLSSPNTLYFLATDGTFLVPSNLRVAMLLGQVNCRNGQEANRILAFSAYCCHLQSIGNCMPVYPVFSLLLFISHPQLSIYASLHICIDYAHWLQIDSAYMCNIYIYIHIIHMYIYVQITHICMYIYIYTY